MLKKYKWSQIIDVEVDLLIFVTGSRRSLFVFCHDLVHPVVVITRLEEADHPCLYRHGVRAHVSADCPAVDTCVLDPGKRDRHNLGNHGPSRV